MSSGCTINVLTSGNLPAKKTYQIIPTVMKTKDLQVKFRDEVVRKKKDYRMLSEALKRPKRTMNSQDQAILLN